MKVVLLGTGTSQGVPVIGCNCNVCKSTDYKDKRLRTSVYIEYKKHNILIDAGPDFRQQMLRENIKKLDSIIFTHEHKDHLGGLDDVRAFNFMTKKPMDIYAESRVQESLRKEYAYAFTAKSYPGVPKLNLNSISEEAFKISNNINVTPIRIMHHRLPILGFRIGDLSYITDANYISDDEKEKIMGSKVIIINALRQEKHISHFSLEEAVEIAKECGARKTYFTHISHHMGLHKDVNNRLPDNMELAYDGLSFYM